MKKVVENSFAVTGFVGKDAEIRQFTTASVARFPLAVSRKEQNGEEYVSSFIYVEAWRKNDSTSFELLKKGKNITVKGFFKPDEWRELYGQLLSPEHFIDKSLPDKWYGAQGNFHKVYVVEILKVWEK